MRCVGWGMVGPGPGSLDGEQPAGRHAGPDNSQTPAREMLSCPLLLGAGSRHQVQVWGLVPARPHIPLHPKAESPSARAARGCCLLAQPRSLPLPPPPSWVFAPPRDLHRCAAVPGPLHPSRGACPWPCNTRFNQPQQGMGKQIAATPSMHATAPPGMPNNATSESPAHLRTSSARHGGEQKIWGDFINGILPQTKVTGSDRSLLHQR